MFKQTNEYINLSKIAHLYNSGQMKILGLCKFSLEAGTSHSYPTARCALIIPVSGKAVFKFNDLSFAVSHGVMLHGCPNKMLTITVSEDSDFEYINLYYDADSDLLFTAPIKEVDRVIDLMNEIIDLNNSLAIKNQYLISSLTEQFLELLFSGVQPVNITTETELLKSSLSYIHENYASNITLSHLADYSGETPSRISYLFKKHMGTRPINYLIDYRIKEAIHLLRDTSCSVEAAANEVGYHDALYFSRIFKKRMGFPPSSIKKY